MNARSWLLPIAACVLAGCAVQSTPGSLALPVREAGASVAKGSGSWMLPEAKSEDLLYVADWNDEHVDVYAYPSARHVGELKADEPSGLCVDAASDVWVNEPLKVIEYQHGGVKPIAKLATPGFSYACAVDPASGNLAVTDVQVKGPDGIAVFAHASGQPTVYIDPAMPSPASMGYDDQGNLFVDGNTSRKGSFRFAELPQGAAS
ncbi:MAG TPA: hypothetical protein VGX91_06340 [Candidatus Cybelea sp.]|jgi:hypothetical protein|nr:hypothetical protein [Candidatus Cybelea sp.]